MLRFSRRRKPLRVQQSLNKPAAPDAGVAATAARWLPLGPMRLRVRRMPIVHRDVGKGQRRGEDGRGGKDGKRRETGEVPSTACCHEGRGERVQAYVKSDRKHDRSEVWWRRPSSASPRARFGA